MGTTRSRRRVDGPAIIRTSSPAAAAAELESCGGSGRRRGFVPVLVGKAAGNANEEEELQKFLVRVEALQHPHLVALLEMAAEEFGYQQKGVLTIPCHPLHFQRVLSRINHQP